MNREELAKEFFSEFHVKKTGIDPSMGFSWFLSKLEAYEKRMEEAIKEGYMKGYKDAKNDLDPNMSYEWLKDTNTSDWI